MADGPKIAIAGLSGPVADNLARIKERIPLFASITTVQLRDFIGKSKITRVAPGDVMTRRNTRGDGLYAILDGTAVVTIPASDAADDTVYGASGSGPAKEHAFINAFLASWGAAIDRRKRRGRR